MGRHRLTKQQVLYYLNWTFGMTQEALAQEFATTQQAVSECLKRLERKWPHLFLFTSTRSEAIRTPIQLTKQHDEQVLRTF